MGFHIWVSMRVVCQHYGLLLGPYYTTAPNILGTQKGTMIFTTTYVNFGGSVMGFFALATCLAHDCCKDVVIE